VEKLKETIYIDTKILKIFFVSQKKDTICYIKEVSGYNKEILGR
jgi:hypothetical protein